MALARPLLKRYHAHPFAAQTIRCCPNSGELRELGPDEAAARDLARTVIRAYEHQPVKGAPLCLPGGKVVAADARRAASSRAPPRARATAGTLPQVWANLLHDDLFEILEADDALRRMRAFSTEKWLERTVSDRGSRDDRRKLDALLRELSFLEGVDVPDADDGRCGLPRDMFMVESQPLQEVEVYRGLDDVDLLEGRGLPGDEEDEEDEEA